MKKLTQLLNEIGFSKRLSKDVEDVTADKFEDFGVNVGQLYQTFLKKDLTADPAIAQKIMNMVDTDDDSALASQIKDLEFLVNQLPDKIESVLQEFEDLKKSHGELQGKLSKASAESLLDQIEDIDGIPYIGGILSVTDSDQLREIGDWLRDKMVRGIVALGAILNERPSLVVMVSSDLVKEGFDAGSIARASAKLMDGGGGGGSATAQAGGKNPDALNSAIDEIPRLIVETKRK